jgi:hypothetical protein
MSLAVGASQKNSRAEFALVRSNPAFDQTSKIFRLFYAAHVERLGSQRQSVIDPLL